MASRPALHLICVIGWLLFWWIPERAPCLRRCRSFSTVGGRRNRSARPMWKRVPLPYRVAHRVVADELRLLFDTVAMTHRFCLTVLVGSSYMPITACFFLTVKCVCFYSVKVLPMNGPSCSTTGPVACSVFSRAFFCVAPFTLRLLRV